MGGVCRRAFDLGWWLFGSLSLFVVLLAGQARAAVPVIDRPVVDEAEVLTAAERDSIEEER